MTDQWVRRVSTCELFSTPRDLDLRMMLVKLRSPSKQSMGSHFCRRSHKKIICKNHSLYLLDRNRCSRPIRFLTYRAQTLMLQENQWDQIPWAFPRQIKLNSRLKVVISSEASSAWMRAKERLTWRKSLAPKTLQGVFPGRAYRWRRLVKKIRSMNKHYQDIQLNPPRKRPRSLLCSEVSTKHLRPWGWLRTHRVGSMMKGRLRERVSIGLMRQTKRIPKYIT